MNIPIQTDDVPMRKRPWGEVPFAFLVNLSWFMSFIVGIILIPIHDLPITAWIAWGLWFAINLSVTLFLQTKRMVPLEAPVSKKEIQGTSLFKDAINRLKQNQLATLSAGVLILMMICCFGQSIIAKAIHPDIDDPKSIVALENSFLSIHFDHTRLNKEESFSPPSTRHWFGTDFAGRDIFARTLYGGTISFLVALVATIVSLIIGVSWGAISGYTGGKTDHYMMRFVDVLYGLPFMFLIILIMTLVNGVHTTASQNRDIVTQYEDFLAEGKTEEADKVLQENELTTNLGTVKAAIWLDNNISPVFVMFIAIGLVSWLTMARITRGQVLSLKQREFITAAKTIGAGNMRIIFLHIVPNLLGPVIIYTTLTIPTVMLTESFLSFLGLGISEPQCSWGSLASAGWKEINVIKPYWWLVAYPTLAMFLTLFSLNFIGDGLRDALDPKMKR